MARTPRTPYYLLLALMFLAGAGLRLWNLPERGLHTHDEGRYLIVADSYLFAARTALGGEGADLSALGEALRRRGGSFFAHGKEGHIFLLAVWRALAGQSVFANTFFSILLSLGAAWMLYRLMRGWLHRPGAAVAAATALILSPLYLHYSRSVLSEASSLFFLLAGFALARRNWTDFHHGLPVQRLALRAFAAGCLAGIAFTCHYNKAWAIALAVFVWAYASIKGSSAWRGGLMRLMGMAAAGFALPLLMLQLITLAVAWKAGVAYPEYKTYFGDLWYHFTTFHAGAATGSAGEGTGAGGANPLYGLALLIEWRGWAGTALLLSTLGAGIVLSRRRHEFLLRTILLFLIPPLMFFSFYRFQVERSFVGLEAAWAALIGVVWWRVLASMFEMRSAAKSDARAMKHSARPVLVTVCVCAVIFVTTFPIAVQVVRHDASTFQQAARAFAPLLIERGGRVTAGSVTWHARPQWIVYMNGEVERRVEGGGALGDYVDWSRDALGDYLLLEEFEYADSPLFPPALTAGREPLLSIPAQAHTPEIRIYDLRP